MTWAMSTDTETTVPPEELAAEARGFFELPSAPGEPLPPPLTPAVEMAAPAPSVGAGPGGGGPSLPPAAPIAPATQPAAPTNGYLDLEALTAPSTPATHVRRRGRRGVSWFVLLALLAGAAVAGIRYGPDLFELTSSEDDPSTDAPLVFPVATAPVEPVRSARISVSRSDASGESSGYDATVDFESGVAQAIVDRGDLPSLEIRAVFDDAVIRRVDQDVWYRTARGGFPFDGSGQDALVRTLDQALPTELRSATTIIEATDTPFTEIIADDQAEDGGAELPGIATATRTTAETMRRLVIDVDQQQIAALQAPALTAPPTDAGAGLATQPASDAAIETPAEPPALTLPIGSGATPVSGEPVQLEVWIDRSGIVRHVTADVALGSESFTVLSTSSEAWLPTFPDERNVRELTAQAMLDLGL